MNKELVKRFYSNMYKTWRFEQGVFEFYKIGQMAGLAHLYIGEEAVTADARVAVEARGYIASTRRGYGHLVARGVNVGRMMVEILGEEMGYSKGRGGSMHIMAMDLGILGANGIMGGGIPMTTGADYLAKYRGTDQVTLYLFGDGAANEGIFRKPISMVATWDLPVVYVVEDSLHSTTVDSRRITKEHDLAERATDYGIPDYITDGNDVETVYKTVQKTVKHARESRGSSIVECKTYCHHDHNDSDPGIYRPSEEVEVRKAKDPLILFRDKGYLTEKERKEAENKVERGVQAACKFIIESPYPEASELMDGIFYD